MEVLSDHKNLTYFRKAQKLNRRQARWSLYLSEFDLKLTHTAGTKMGQSDALSRRSDHCPDEDHDNEDIVMLDNELFIGLLDMDLQERIANGKIMDFDASEAMETLLGNGPITLQNDLEDWKLETINNKKILFYKGKSYIPKDDEL